MSVQEVKMKRFLRVRRAALVAGLLLGALCLTAGPELWAKAKRKNPPAPEQFSSLSFVVLRDSDGKPLQNASVVLHFLRPDGRQGEGFELKTDGEGRATIQDIPYGRLRVQVVAHGLRTYGDDVEIHSAQQEFVLRLKPPAPQVSEEQ
jgi:hypothetical protein